MLFPCPHFGGAGVVGAELVDEPLELGAACVVRVDLGQRHHAVDERLHEAFS